jgi:hypothetical protein
MTRFLFNFGGRNSSLLYVINLFLFCLNSNSALRYTIYCTFSVINLSQFLQCFGITLVQHSPFEFSFYNRSFEHWYDYNLGETIYTRYLNLSGIFVSSVGILVPETLPARNEPLL